MPILWLAPGDTQQPHGPVRGLHAAEDWDAARRIPRQSPRPRQAGHDTEGAMGYRHDDDGGGAVVWAAGMMALTGAVAAASLLWWAL